MHPSLVVSKIVHVPAELGGWMDCLLCRSRTAHQLSACSSSCPSQFELIQQRLLVVTSHCNVRKRRPDRGTCPRSAIPSGWIYLHRTRWLSNQGNGIENNPSTVVHWYRAAVLFISQDPYPHPDVYGFGSVRETLNYITAGNLERHSCRLVTGFCTAPMTCLG